MGMFEWWGEQWNPGRVGGVDLMEDRPVPQSAGLTFARFGLTLATVFGAAVAAMLVPQEPSPVLVLQVAGALVAYIVIATILRPKPDMKNMGFAGGLIDNPFRYSDDLNRGLMWLAILFWPGRFLGNGVVDMYRWLAAGEEE
jgi:hypothetical protein